MNDHFTSTEADAGLYARAHADRTTTVPPPATSPPPASTGATSTASTVPTRSSRRPRRTTAARTSWPSAASSARTARPSPPRQPTSSGAATCSPRCTPSTWPRWQPSGPPRWLSPATARRGRAGTWFGAQTIADTWGDVSTTPTSLPSEPPRSGSRATSPTLPERAGKGPPGSAAHAPTASLARGHWPRGPHLRQRPRFPQGEWALTFTRAGTPSWTQDPRLRAH